MGIERDSFYNGSTQIMAYKRDGLMIPPAPIDSYLIFRGSTFDGNEKLLPFADAQGYIQPLSVFFQTTNNSPVTITFRAKKMIPATETIYELSVTSSGFVFPTMILDPHFYAYFIQCSSNVKNLSLFAKFADIYNIYSIV